MPTHEEIASLAYHLYLDRGRQPGHEQDDWFCAEQLLTSQINLEEASRRTMNFEPQSPRSRRQMK
jgi:hypothetical protein